MAGHSKWANIKHRKAGQDAKRGKLFTKLIREITVAAKGGGGGDIANNPSLRAAVDKALGANMKRDTVENTIKKATGNVEGVNYEEVRLASCPALRCLILAHLLCPAMISLFMFIYATLALYSYHYKRLRLV
jgi:transcriptional/translational regulatory protein YebC/TACO1